MILSNDRFVVCLPSPETINYGDALEHASTIISKHLDATTQRYKIGYTHLPLTRFYKDYQNGKPSYAKEHNHMIILAALSDIQAAGMMEASLIREFNVLRKLPGCANIKRGGDNIVGAPPGFVHIALMTLSAS